MFVCVRDERESHRQTGRARQRDRWGDGPTSDRQTPVKTSTLRQINKRWKERKMSVKILKHTQKETLPRDQEKKQQPHKLKDGKRKLNSACWLSWTKYSASHTITLPDYFVLVMTMANISQAYVCVSVCVCVCQHASNCGSPRSIVWHLPQ